MSSLAICFYTLVFKLRETPGITYAKFVLFNSEMFWKRDAFVLQCLGYRGQLIVRSSRHQVFPAVCGHNCSVTTDSLNHTR